MTRIRRYSYETYRANRRKRAIMRVFWLCAGLAWLAVMIGLIK